VNFTVVCVADPSCLSVTGRNALDARGAVFVFDFAEAPTVSFTVKAPPMRVSASAALAYEQTYIAQHAMRVIILMLTLPVSLKYSARRKIAFQTIDSNVIYGRAIHRALNAS
jgi:hypothetical protein